MRCCFIRGVCSEKQCQLVVNGLKSCCLRSADLAAGRGGSCDPRKQLTREQAVLTFKDGCLSDTTGLSVTASPPYPGASSTGSCVRMFTHSAAPRTLWRHVGLHGLLGSGEGAAGGPLRAQVQKLQWVSVAGCASDCSWRGLGTKARGRSKKEEAKMVSGEGIKQKAPKTRKRRSVEAKGRRLCSDEPAGTEEAAAVAASRDSCGAIHVILGPMFAGKSTALLQRVQDEASTGRKVALVKSDKDTRYDLSAIVTHDGLKMPCYAVPDLATFKTRIGDKFYKELDVIGIDEAQFFADLYEFCQHAADFEGKTVIVAGLDGDFLRRRFGSTLDLIPVADSVVKLSSRCEICGQPAIFSFRKTLDIHTELVGGADVYMPVCRQHFVNGQIVVETASTVIGAHQVAQMNND